MIGLLIAAGRGQTLDFDGAIEVGHLLVLGVGVAGASALLLYGIGRLRGGNVRPAWTWALLPASLAIFAAAIAFAARGWRLVSIAAGVAVGSCVSAYLLFQTHRTDLSSQRPERRRLAASRLGPLELVDRVLARRRFERGPVQGLSASPLRQLAGAGLPAGIALGRDGRGRPVVVGQQQLMRSALITGTVGSGKTTTAQWIVSRMLRGGFGAIWVEAKGDPEMREWLMAEAALRGVRYREFRIAGESMRWNPLASAAGPVERRDLVYRATASNQLEGSPEYFVALFKQHALMVLRALELAGKEPSLPAMRRYWSFERLFELPTSEDPRGRDLASYLSELKSERNARRRAEVESTGARLGDVVDAIGPRLAGSDSPGAQLDLREVISERSICLISLDAATYPAVTAALGQLAVADVMAATAPWIERRELARCVLVLDEFPRYAGSQVGELMALTARAAGLPVILATQDIADLDLVGEQFRSQIMGVANYYVVHAIGSHESADYLARIAGQQERITATHQTERHMLGLERSTGLGTEAHGREWLVHPSTLQGLRTGQAALITKNPHSAGVLRVSRPEGSAELLARYNAVRAGRGCRPVDFAELSHLHAVARARADRSASSDLGRF